MPCPILILYTIHESVDEGTKKNEEKILVMSYNNSLSILHSSLPYPYSYIDDDYDNYGGCSSNTKLRDECVCVWVV